MDQAYPESTKLSKEEPLPNGASTMRKMLPTATKEEEDRQCREAPRPRKKLPSLRKAQTTLGKEWHFTTTQERLWLKD